MLELGARRISDVKPQDIAKLHHKLRAVPAEANHAIAVSSAMFNYAERIGWRPEGSNPCRHIERYPLRHHERFLTADELARLGDALAAYAGSPYVTAAIKLL